MASGIRLSLPALRRDHPQAEHVAGPSAETDPRPYERLHSDAWLNIFSYLSIVDLDRAGKALRDIPNARQAHALAIRDWWLSHPHLRARPSFPFPRYGTREAAAFDGALVQRMGCAHRAMVPSLPAQMLRADEAWPQKMSPHDAPVGLPTEHGWRVLRQSELSHDPQGRVLVGLAPGEAPTMMPITGVSPYRNPNAGLPPYTNSQSLSIREMFAHGRVCVTLDSNYGLLGAVGWQQNALGGENPVWLPCSLPEGVASHSPGLVAIDETRGIYLTRLAGPCLLTIPPCGTRPPTRTAIGRYNPVLDNTTRMEVAPNKHWVYVAGKGPNGHIQSFVLLGVRSGYAPVLVPITLPPGQQGVEDDAGEQQLLTRPFASIQFLYEGKHGALLRNPRGEIRWLDVTIAETDDTVDGMRLCTGTAVLRKIAAPAENGFSVHDAYVPKGYENVWCGPHAALVWRASDPMGLKIWALDGFGPNVARAEVKWTHIEGLSPLPISVAPGSTPLYEAHKPLAIEFSPTHDWAFCTQGKHIAWLGGLDHARGAPLTWHSVLPANGTQQPKHGARSMIHALHAIEHVRIAPNGKWGITMSTVRNTLGILIKHNADTTGGSGPRVTWNYGHCEPAGGWGGSPRILFDDNAEWALVQTFDNVSGYMVRPDTLPHVTQVLPARIPRMHRFPDGPKTHLELRRWWPIMTNPHNLLNPLLAVSEDYRLLALDVCPPGKPAGTAQWVAMGTSDVVHQLRHDGWQIVHMFPTEAGELVTTYRRFRYEGFFRLHPVEERKIIKWEKRDGSN